MSSINKNSSTPLGCGMNCKINVTSVVSGANSISADISLNPTGRNIGIAAEPDGDPNGRRNAEQAADGDEDDPLCLVCHGVCLLGVFLVNGTIPHFPVEVY